MSRKPKRRKKRIEFVPTDEEKIALSPMINFYLEKSEEQFMRAKTQKEKLEIIDRLLGYQSAGIHGQLRASGVGAHAEASRFRQTDRMAFNMREKLDSDGKLSKILFERRDRE